MVRVAETVRTVSEGEGQVPLVHIVSDLAYQAAKTLGREDLLRPGPAVRDENGRIIGCKGLAI